jgi:hypothetical protein
MYRASRAVKASMIRRLKAGRDRPAGVGYLGRAFVQASGHPSEIIKELIKPVDNKRLSLSAAISRE